MFSSSKSVMVGVLDAIAPDDGRKESGSDRKRFGAERGLKGPDASLLLFLRNAVDAVAKSSSAHMRVAIFARIL